MNRTELIYVFEFENPFSDFNGKSEDVDWSGYKKPQNKLRRIAEAVILEIYPPPGGPPAWKKRSTIVEEVNERIVKRGYWTKPVSASTINRALGRLSDIYDRPDIKVRKA
jgi:hypothetical protein